MAQKFKRYSLVEITHLPENMSHFPKERLAYVYASYHQQYGAGSRNEYSLALLNKKEKVVNICSWYPASILTLKNSSAKTKLKAIEEIDCFCDFLELED